jgi:uncharacterized membrane protein
MAECQLVITLWLVVAAEWLLGAIGLTGWPVGLFRVLLLAAAGQVLLLTVVVLLLYFELHAEALGVCLWFCVANTVGTAWAAGAATADWWGAGYLASTASAFLIGVALLEWRMRRITFLIFTRQPIVQAR